MRLINRIVIVIKPRQPFVDWVNSTEDTDKKKYSLKDFVNDNNTYLIPNFEDLAEIDDYVEQNFQNFFELELDDWYTDESKWPKEISYESFKEWFDVEYHTMVIDIADEPLKSEDG